MTIDELRAKLNRYTETPESMHRLVLGLELATTLIAVAPALFDIAEAAEYARQMVESLPSGIDEEADESNPCPEDATAHVGGIIHRRLAAALARLADAKA